jgi:hypothetical protein
VRQLALRTRIAAWGLIVTAAACSGPTGPEPLPIPAPPPAIACGVERWAVKTLSDAEVAAVDLTPIGTTVSALSGLAPRCSGLGDRRIGPDEFRTFEVVARVTLVRNEGDRDYHVAIADPVTGATMVTEVVDPSCGGAAASPHRETLRLVRAQFDALGAGALVGRTVRLRGVGFYDFDHGQTGRAASCLELHPLVGIEPL